MKMKNLRVYIFKFVNKIPLLIMNGLLDGQNNNNNGKFLTRKYNLSNSSFALDWSHNNDRFCTLAVGSFLPWIENNVCLNI